MPVNLAIRAYKEERLNCAQSVLRAFQTKYNISEEEIFLAKNLGGGRAEAGLCGALYAALRLIDDPPIRHSLQKAFIKSAGSDKCREIRLAKRIPCENCVYLAASLLAECHDKKQPTCKI